MNYLVLAVSLIIQQYQIEPPPYHEPAAKSSAEFQKIRAGLDERTFQAMWPMPARVDHVHAYYSDREIVRYFYLDERCQFQMHACTVDVENGRVSSARDIKPEYF